jgi:aryl-alcohol dehydrogenase-like predicted oxidoreductase
MNMKKHKLGDSELVVSALGLGCVGSSDPPGRRQDDHDLVATVQRAIELGVNFFDTADVYGMGHNEELLGKTLRSHREKVIIATKFGHLREANGTYGQINGRPEFVRASCEGSLKRLKMEVIDLYYQHRVDSTVPIEETVGAMAQLVKEGKVRFLGLCESAAQTIRRACAVHPIAALQSEYSLWTRDIESEILPTCRDLGVGFVAFSPLGRGFFTGAIRDAKSQIPEGDFRRGLPRFQPENFTRNVQLLQELESIAKSKGLKPAQLALAWLLAQGDDIVPIPGTKKQAHLEENLEAVNIKLDQSDLNGLGEIFHRDRVAGMRYPEAGLRKVNL